jgi:hypothetical protein
MTDTNQKLREALQAISHIDDSTNHAVDASAALDRIGKIARQALALPTADHIPDAGEMVVDHLPDAGKMIETAEQVDDINVAESFTSAAPVGEREAFEHTMMDKFGWERKDFKTDEFGYFDGHTVTAWMTWQARAALSAGDAVDAQRYRWLMGNCTLGIKQNGVGWSLNTTACIAPDCIKDVGAAIDAAMRKGQL